MNTANSTPSPDQAEAPIDSSAAPRPATAGAALALIAAVLALLGQYLLVIERSAWLAAAAYAGGIAAFLWLMALDRNHPARRPRAERRDRLPDRASLTATLRSVAGLPRAAVVSLRQAAGAAPLRAALLVLALALALVVAGVLHRRAEADVGYGDVLVLWLLSMGLYLLAMAFPRAPVTRAAIHAWLRRHRSVMLDVGILLALALALRLTALDVIPLGLQHDEGNIGIRARILATSAHPQMFATMTSYSTLFFYLHGLVVVALDGGIAALRLLNATAGALAVPATYLAGRQLFDRRVGLVAASLLALSHMHIHMSRIAIGQAIDTLASALIIFTLIRGLDRRSPHWMALAGIGLGLAQYGYIGLRTFDLVALTFVVWMAVVNPTFLRRSLVGLAAAFGGAVVAAAPMIRYAIDRPAAYIERATVMGVVSSGELGNRMLSGGRPAWQIFAEQARDAVMAIIANPVVAFYFSRLPMLDLVWGALAVLGLAYAVSRMREPRFALLVFAVLGAVTLLSLSIFAAIAANRVTGLLPTLAILAAFSLSALARRGLAGLGLPARAPDAVIVGVVALMAAYNLNYYFGEYQRACVYTDPNLQVANLAAETIAAQAPGTEAFLLAPPGTVFGGYDSPPYLTGRQERDLAALPPDTPQPGEPGSIGFVYSIGEPVSRLVETARRVRAGVVLARPERGPDLDAVARAVPGGERTSLARCGVVMFEVYRWPGGRPP
jgi:4-amino-4-deoxy-L-arabinose transferase-like glycosyltransferase